MLVVRLGFGRHKGIFHAFRTYCKSVNSSFPLLQIESVKSFLNKIREDAASFHKFGAFAEKRPAMKAKQISRALEACSKIAIIQSEISDLQAFTDGAPSEKGSEDLRQMARDDILIRSEFLFNSLFELVEVVYPAVGAELDAATLEISAGVGGQEAMIWTNDLFTMYEKVCPSLGLKFNAIDCDHTEIGGARKAYADIVGPEAYTIMRYEGGIHRVQRVPKTERLGRLHTSTAAVVIMPLPNEIQVAINPSDLTVTTFRSSGPGGQHVNRTDSAVRMVHNPTGIMVTCQEERSQHKNRELALSKLRAILYENQLESQLANERANRRLQAGTKSRSEKIRTYNWPRRRVTDHRLSSEIPGIHDLDDAVAGGQTLVNIIHALQATDREDRLMSMVQDFNAFK